MGRRGPKRKDVKREPNGRASRRAVDRQEAFARDERETMSVAVGARQRHYGLSEKDARDQKGGSVIGRLKQNGAISAAQYEAAERYRISLELYHICRSSPKEPTAVDLNRVHGLVPTSDEKWSQWAQKRVERHEAARRVVQEAQNELRGTANLWAALDVFIRQDVYVDGLLGDLRSALNALSRFYGTNRIRAA